MQNSENRPIPGFSKPKQHVIIGQTAGPYPDRQCKETSMEKAFKLFVRWGWIPAIVLVGILYIMDLMQ